LQRHGIEPVIPHRRNRTKPPTQDGRVLRRYKRRQKIERLFAWLGGWRRLLIRHDALPEMYGAFFHLACLVSVLRNF